MKKSLPIIFFLLIFTLTLQGQKDTSNVIKVSCSERVFKEKLQILMSAYILFR